MNDASADALGFLAYLGLIVFCGFYAEEIGRRLWGPKIRVPCNEWRDLVEPIVKKFRLAKTLEANTTFNPEGSNALATLLERMASELDRRS